MLRGLGFRVQGFRVWGLGASVWPVWGLGISRIRLVVGDCRSWGWG